ncbi:MAG: MFS transporter [Candidatus Aenigmarchaeota archaeon]|nr:MFS transporter [Candidatus Aenigmarchaeota archaeon]
MDEKTTRRKNLRLFTISNSFMAFAFGLFGPFYYIFINEMGGTIENFGIAAGLVVLSSAFVSLIAGKYSDKFGRKPFLIIGVYASALIAFLYTVIGSLWQLYLLQIVGGLVISIFETSEASFLGDMTKKESRGADMGKYSAVIGIAEAIAIFAGGFLVGKFGFEVVFYIVSVIFVISTTLLLKLKE